uniref:Large ribosomal subunit protein uL5c n=1 Tax=Chloropicon mariensis TaxID=1606511 RepID=A0A4D6C286_9CHLO|nr:ribosomal protein L5 [Chloropicon mariensis]QBX97862.1 ribosomal protein L5 [Chloropicon mariensis]UQK95289.1 ribosomal protein L5 [Chloropicon mariensis]
MKHYIERYEQLIKSKHFDSFNYKNLHQLPRISKIVVNRGVGEVAQNPKYLETCLNELSVITGQKPNVTRSKKAIASFKIREDMPVGMSVTLRGDKMNAFFDRLVHLALPRIRDFQGVSLKGFDGKGNYSLGLEEQLMFPEIDYDEIDQVRGMDICVVTSCKTDAESLSLLQGLGVPFATN